MKMPGHNLKAKMNKKSFHEKKMIWLIPNQDVHDQNAKHAITESH